MNMNYQALLPTDFSPDSRVWVYQSTRLFTISEALEIEKRLNEFVVGWQSHGDPVKGYANLFFGQFIVLMADESAAGVSGCSTDSSVRLLKKLESDLGVVLFDRLHLAFLLKNKVQVMPLSQLSYAVTHGFIDADTPFFNNLVQTRQELEEKWIVPAGQSWLARRISFEKSVG